ncbi:evolutionarily conserved C-terminal region 7 [Abeliophyllum distichum]|uniref:YTH domain-containing family protein n=1 Tax=Abeliophyllum distichum TaxID=126358 RepID=A0ABD1VC11_9LAMI
MEVYNVPEQGHADAYLRMLFNKVRHCWSLRCKVLNQIHRFLVYSMNNLKPCTTKEPQSLLAIRACIILLPPTMDIFVQHLNHLETGMTAIGILVWMVKKFSTRVCQTKVFHMYIIHLAMDMHNHHITHITHTFLVQWWELMDHLLGHNSTIPYRRTRILLSSPAYIPMIANSTTDVFVDNVASVNRADGPALKHNLSSKSPKFSPTPLGTASSQANSVIRLSEGTRANAGSSKQPMTHGSATSRSFPSSASSQIPQGKSAVVMENVPNGKVLSSRSPLKNAPPAGNGFSGFGPSNYAQASLDKVRSKVLYGRAPDDVKVSTDALTEQNRGPRTNKLKNQLAVKAYTTRVGDSDAQGNIIIYTDQYNKGDFPVDYMNAKFFVIKSYSEDDVHKSIKYNVWSSTPNGNKKLNSAYEDAQRIAAADSRGCCIFLFFSVNASGQFCGVAEMTGPVDFHKDMDFWQQDKWSGSFPVKWHIIKDVPNPNFRHIILENNENKPVTNSRDTQEIYYKKGMEMLKIFKNYVSKTSLLDDFMYYENRQRILQEEKARLLVKSYENPYLVPLIDPPRKLNPILDSSPSDDKKVDLHDDTSSSNKNNKNESDSSEEVCTDAVSVDGKPKH